MTGPPDERSRPLGQRAAPAATLTTTASVTGSIPDPCDGADPLDVGELLSVWLGIKLDQVDDLVEEARAKVDAIPDWKVIAQIVGELVVRCHALEAEVAELKGARS